MNRPPRDLELLLIDGNNLLHRTSGGVEAAHQRALVARLRAALPGVRKIVMLDGYRPAHGDPSPIDRLLEVRHAGGPADDALVAQVRDLPPAMRAQTVVVTDDRALTERVRSAGARTQRLAWLVAQLDRPAPPAGIAASRPARRSIEPSDDERPAWQPGRGATCKRGNPRRGPRRRGPPLS